MELKHSNISDFNGTIAKIRSDLQDIQARFLVMNVTVNESVSTSDALIQSQENS